MEETEQHHPDALEEEGGAARLEMNRGQGRETTPHGQHATVHLVLPGPLAELLCQWPASQLLKGILKARLEGRCVCVCVFVVPVRMLFTCLPVLSPLLPSPCVCN